MVLGVGDDCKRPLEVESDNVDELDVSGVGTSSNVEVIVSAWAVALCEDSDILVERC